MLTLALTCRLFGAWRVVPKPTVEHMLDTVRNRLLNFILEIEEVEPNAGEVPSINRIDTTVTRQIFNRCIMNNYEGPVHNIQDNKGSNIATDSAKISSSSATYQGGESIGSLLTDMKQHIEEVAEGDASTWSMRWSL